MLQKMSLDQFVSLSSHNQRVAASVEIYGDMLTPVSVFRHFSQGQSEAALLDSSSHSDAVDACVYMGFDPLAEFSSAGHEVTVRIKDEESVTTEADPMNALRQFFNQYKGASLKTLAKFAGGMIGYMSYDVVRIFEEIPDRHLNKDNIPDMCFKFYGTHIVFDKRSGKAIVAKVVEVKGDPAAAYEQAMQDLDAIIDKMMAGSATPFTRPDVESGSHPEVTTDLSDDEYKVLVEKAQHYIRQGDAFQKAAVSW